MSYGAPCERGVSAADMMPLQDMEVPGLIPDVGEVKLAPKEARRGCQCDRRQRHQEETALHRERSLVDHDWCFSVIAEAVDSHCQELKVILRGLDLCKSTLCSEVAEMRIWVTSALEEQQKMLLRVMGEVVKLRKAIEGSRRARSAEGKIAKEGSEFSGGYSLQETDAPMVEVSNKGKTLGKPTLPVEDPTMQVRVCAGSRDSAAGAVGGTPDRPRLSMAPGVHVRGGQWAPPTLAAISGRAGKVAVEKHTGRVHSEV